MKTIIKSPANECLREAQDKGWSWTDFVENAHNDYLQVRNQALADQGQECAYTGLWLGEHTSQKLHIDHFLKRSLYPEHQFNWDNLFAAAKDLNCGSDYKDHNIHGPKANSDNQYQNFYSPLEANLEGMFWYQQNGQVVVHPCVGDENKAKVQQTIDMYNLNAVDLVHRRAGVISDIRDLQQIDDDMIRECMKSRGFSFVVEFELQHRER